MINERPEVPVSVVIPCFRCSGTITRAIDSIKLQSNKPAEVILVDDASGEETLQVLQKLSKESHGWIKLVQLKDNCGAASARNAGWEIASQPYIAFLDADDAWHPDKLEIQHAYMKNHPQVILCGHAHRMIRKVNILPDWKIGTWTVQQIYKWQLLISNRFVTPSVMLRREIDYRFVEGQRYMEDHMMWLETVCAGGVVVKLSAELAAIYKDSYGAKGLSSRLWDMERADLGNYLRLYRDNCINVFNFSALSIFSFLKYVRRLMIYYGYMKWKS